MEIKEVKSLSDLQKKLKGGERSYLMIFKKGSGQSDCAMENFAEASGKIQGINLFSVDVSEVSDVHPFYKVTTAPTMIEFNGKEPKNIVKGCHETGFFKAILEDAVSFVSANDDDKSQKRVIVYSTPTCSWCNTLKSYLRQNKIRFREIDVSRNQSAARTMVNKSGQQGVPQTEINGQIIVGFDKPKINKLLGING